MSNFTTRILLIEDSEDDEFLLRRQLNKKGYSFFLQRVQTLEHVKLSLREADWDIILTDHKLPGFASFDVLVLVQELAIDIPVIILSGHMPEETAVKAMRMGAVDYCMKDNYTRLLPAIDREVSQARSRKAKYTAEKTIKHMAEHDNLTGIPNRYQFESKLNQLLQDNKPFQSCLLYIDIDLFKLINDTAGHNAGDELLKYFSNFLITQIRASDFVARLGGDEFVILLEKCSLVQAELLAKKIIAATQSLAYTHDENRYNIRCSIGIAEILPIYTHANELLSLADLACHAAKNSGRNRASVFRPEDDESMQQQREMMWVSRINDGMDQQLFVLFQQLILGVSDQSGSKNYLEFLLRLKDKDGNLIPPIVFIPAAERYNLMPALDRWVIDQSFTYIAAHHLENLEQGIHKYFINLSGATLNDDSFVAYVKSKMESSQVDPAKICFEITETAAISNLGRSKDFIQEIRNMGCSFALDDFGSGMCSFSYLKNIPVDYLKIDGGFVKDMLSDQMNNAIVESINQIGHIVGLKTIAEYVENDEILERLKCVGVDFAQGYSIRRPAPLADLRL
jgi:diguanylate cyclase (GGDEF)-like protein